MPRKTDMSCTRCDHELNLRAEKCRLWAFPTVTAALSILSLIASMTWIAPVLQYDQSLQPSTIYRILTCHWAHWSLSHLGWSLGAFIVLGTICETRSRVSYLLCVLISSVAIPVSLCVFEPSLLTYRGLSGIDSALFFLAAVPMIRDRWKRGEPGGVLLLVLPLLFVGKLFYEHSTGSAIFVDQATLFAPVPLAHLTGSLIGALCSLMRGGIPE